MSLYTGISNYNKYMSNIMRTETKITISDNIEINETKLQKDTLIEKLKTEQVKIYHFHLPDTSDKNTISHMTLATKIINDTEIIFGVTFCSAKDKFNKQIGTQLAYENLTHNPIYLLVPKLKAKKILRKVFGYLAANNKVKDAEYIILYNLAKYLYNL